MTRLFGWLLAVVGLASQSNAALLVKYDFTGIDADARSRATSKAAGVDASPFAGSGNFNTAGFFTGSANLNGTTNAFQGGFTLSALSATGLAITKIVYNFKGSTNTTSGVSRTQAVELQLTSGESLTESQVITSSSNPLKLASYDLEEALIYTPIGELGPLGFNFSSKFQSGNANNNIKFQLDYVEVYGELVPEPASMAVFGLLAAPVALRRLRRKS
jgi:hypothetical protein